MKANPSRAVWVGGVAAAVLLVGAGIAYASKPSTPAKAAGPSLPAKLTLVNGLLAVENMTPAGPGQVLVPPTGGTVTSAVVDSVVYGSRVPVYVSASFDGSFVSITPSGSTPSMAIVKVNYTDAAGFTGNVCTLVVIVGAVPSMPLTLVNGALPLQTMTRKGVPLTIAAPPGAKVTKAVVDSVTYGSHVGVAVSTDGSSVTISPTGDGPSTAVIDVAYTDATGYAGNVCTIVVSVT